MNENQKYACTSELAAEVLMVMTSSIIAITIGGVAAQKFLLLFRERTHINFTNKNSGVVISSAYALFLPLMSYLFSQAKENSLEGRAQLILSWMVLTEVLQVYDDDSTWEVRKSAEQLARLVWVSYLVYGYVPPNKLRATLLVLCAVCITYEVMKAISSKKAKKSYLLGRNPKLIHHYMNTKMLQDDHKTTPMSDCKYIVMAEENHEITICENGYHLGNIKPGTEGAITIGKVFEMNLSDNNSKFTLAHPNWRDSCLSFALAKMLRLRFANLPVDEDGNDKALKFVLEGLIPDIESSGDVVTEGSKGERNPIERVFCIIHDELKFVREFSQTKVQIYKYFGWYVLLVDMIGYMIVLGIGLYLILAIAFSILGETGLTSYLVWQDAYSHCSFHIFRNGTRVTKIFSLLDQAITFLLVSACGYVQYYNGWAAFFSYRKSNLNFVKRYVENPKEWVKSHSSTPSMLDKLLNRFEKFVLSIVENVEQARIHYSIFDTKAETTFYIKRNPRREVPVVIHSTDVKEAILRSLRKSGRKCQKKLSRTNVKETKELWCKNNYTIF